MAAPSIINIIPPAVGYPNSTEIPGFRLYQYPGLAFVRRLPAECQSCALHNAHKVFNRIGLSPSGPVTVTIFIDENNKMCDRVEQLKTMIMLMDRTYNGIYNPSAYAIGGYPVAHEVGWYKLIAANGYTATCQYQEGNPDPRAFTYPPAGDATRRALSGGGPVMLVNDVSQLYPCTGPTADGGGWIVRSFDIDPDLAVDGTFTVNLMTPIGGIILDKLPGEEANDVRVAFSFYCGPASENWPETRKIYPFWAIKKILALEVTEQAVYEIEPAARIVMDSNLITATIDGEVVDLSTLIHVEHTETGYKTTLDLTDYSLDYPKTINLTYWIEDTSTNKQWRGQDRCAWSLCDLTGSWGQTDGTNGKFVCGYINSEGELADLRAAFKPQCYQTQCSGWTPDTTWANPLDAMLYRITHGIPWLLAQQLAGDPTYVLQRWECPSLMSLTDDFLWTAAGYHIDKNWRIGMGGWPRAVNWTEDGKSCVHGVGGLEMLMKNSSGGYPDITNSGSWPDYGPAGNNYSRPLDYGAANADITSDPYKIVRSMIGDSSVDRNLYTAYMSGCNGRYQRWRVFHFHAPRIRIVAGSSQTYRGFAFYRGFWDANFNSQTTENAGGISTVYYWRAVIDPIQTPAGWGYEGQVIVKTASLASSNLTLTLRNKTVWAMSQTAPQVETQTSWRQCGMDVPLPQWSRIRNYDCEQATLGPGRRAPGGGYLRAGMCIKFDDADIPNDHPLKNRKLLVTAVNPAVTGTHDTWDPNGSDWAGDEPEHTFYLANVALHATSLPDASHETWACRCAQITVRDENGIAADYLAGHSLDGLSLSVYSDPVMDYTGHAALVSPNQISEAPIDPGNYAVFGADGEIYIKGGGILAAGNCLTLKLRMADRTCWLDFREANSWTTAMARMLYE